MSETTFNTLMVLFEACRTIKAVNSKIQTLELLPAKTPVEEVYHSDNMVLMQLPDAEDMTISGKYCLDLHTDESVLGNYSVFSIRKEIYINDKISVDKTESFNLSVPKLLLAIVTIIPTENLDKEDLSIINKNILTILATTVSVSCRDVNYSAKLSVNVRNTLSEITTLRECLKMMAVSEYNPCFIVNDRLKFLNSLNSLINHVEKIAVY